MSILPDRPPADPLELLRDWLPANDDPVRPTMVVSTAEDGIPDARTMLLSAWDDEGFRLHTDSRSRKVEQLAANPAVALTLNLPDAHQLVVRGTASIESGEQAAWAFQHRSLYLQQLAWQNTPEFAGLPLSARREAWRSFAAGHAEGFGKPPTWLGYLVRPTRLVFWQGAPDTASRRIEYSRGGTDADWTAVLRAG